MEQRIILIQVKMDHSIPPAHPHITLTRHNSILQTQLIHTHHAHSLSHTQPPPPPPTYPASHFNGPPFRGGEGAWVLAGLQSEKQLPGVVFSKLMPAGKRHTCPPLQAVSPSRTLLPPAVQSPLSRKITFTYRSPSNKAFPRSSMSYSLLQ